MSLLKVLEKTLYKYLRVSFFLLLVIVKSYNELLKENNTNNYLLVL